MRSIKLLGLAIVLALAATAFTGGSASATVLCKQNYGVDSCAEADFVPLPVTMKVHTPKLALSTEVGCESDITIKVEKSLGEGKGLTGQVTDASLTCGLPCYDEFVNLPYRAEIHEAAGGNGTLTLSNYEGNGNPGVKLSGCLWKGGYYSPKCAWKAEKVDLGFEVTTLPASIVANNEALTPDGVNNYCGYGGLPEKEKNLSLNGFYGLETGLSFSATAKEANLAAPKGTKLVICDSTIGGSQWGSISSYGFSACKGACTGGTSLELPDSSSYVATGQTTGVLTVYEVTLQFTNCLGQTCKFSGTFTLDVNGSQMVANNEPLTQTTKCLFSPSAVWWSGTYSWSGKAWRVVSKP